MATKDNFQVDVKVGTHCCLVSVSGALDIETSSSFEKALSTVLGAGERELVVDLENVSMMDSSAARVLVGIAERLSAEGGSLTIRSASPAVNRFMTTLLDASRRDS